MQAIIDACRDERLDARSCVVISNNSDSMALQRARDAGIAGYHISGRTHPGEAEDAAILETLRRHGVDTVILAGYMKRLGPQTLQAYRGRILNIHPALLPKFGGQGMYGKRVHEAVLQAGENRIDVEYRKTKEEQGPGLEVSINVLPEQLSFRLVTARKQTGKVSATFHVPPTQSEQVSPVEIDDDAS
jgi:phosphoribosylglycinamide formyltransferase-1